MKKLFSSVVALVIAIFMVIGVPMAVFRVSDSDTSFAVYAASYSKGYYKVTPSEGLILRKGAGTSYKKLLVIKKGTRVKVTSVKNGWGKVTVSGKTGWISLKYTKFLSKYLTGKYKVKASDGLILRKGASTSSKKLKVIPYKTVVSVSGFSGDWGATKYKSKSGYVSMEWVDLTEETTAEKEQTEKTTEKTTTNSSITVSGATKPSTLSIYEAFVIKGKITSKYNLKKVRVGICNSKRSWKSGMNVTRKPNKKTFNINSVDEKIMFNNLSKGTFYYRVAAVDSKGYTKAVVMKKFTVKGSNAKYIWPYGNRSKITQYYKSYNWLVGHAGLDIAGAGAYGSSIKASRKGFVMTACYNSSYGYYIVILHDDKYSTVYAHCCKLLVKSGETVKQGQVIGKVGSTGNSTGPHLHFEVRDTSGVKRNPLNYLP